MKLDQQIVDQLHTYLALMEGPVQITVSADDSATSDDIVSLVEQLAAITPRIQVVNAPLQRTPSFSVGDRIVFAGVPLGHEFTSLVMAILQTSGRAPKITQSQRDRITSIAAPLSWTTYVSMSCHNCPDVVQALNTMAALNTNIKHTMVDGAAAVEEVTRKNIMAVPFVELNDEVYGSGRMTLDEILDRVAPVTHGSIDRTYDTLIIGGGPAAASAAIYSARKGIATAMVAERWGGQVADTLGIENLIGTLYTEGPALASALSQQVEQYGVDRFTGVTASGISRDDRIITVSLADGRSIRSKTAIIATGARWRNLGIPGEAEFKNRGVAYCPHCEV